MKIKIFISLIVFLVLGIFFAGEFLNQRYPQPKTIDEAIDLLEKRSSFESVMAAQSSIIRMGKKTVPRLIAELDRTNSELIKSALYSLVSDLDPNTYQQIVLGACKTNTAQLKLILHAPATEKLMMLTNADFINLTNTLAQTFQLETNNEVKKSIEKFFQLLEFHIQHAPSIRITEPSLTTNFECQWTKDLIPNQNYKY